MSVSGGETVTVLRDSLAGPDAYGDQLPHTTQRIPVPNCAVAPGSSAGGAGVEPVELGRATVISDFVVYAPAGVEVRHTDRVEIRGQVCEVVGRPFQWQNPFTGDPVGVVVYANVGEG